MKLATTTEDFSRYTNNQIEAVTYVANSGFHYVDYSFGLDYANKTGIYSSDPKSYISKLKEKCDEYAVQFIQAHSPMGTPLADENEAFINDTLSCIEACGALGIKNIVVHSGYLKNITQKETFKKNKVFFEKLLPTAEKYEVNILTENFNKMTKDDVYWIDNAPDLLELIEYVNHPLFHAVWDTGHANHQEMSQETALTLLGKHVKALHVHDNDGVGDFHMCPFFGTLDVDSLMKGLKNIGYAGYFTFEACSFFAPSIHKNSNIEIDLAMRIKMEELLYSLGENILRRYGM
ncbi:MAG: sugar phosphate isomerase/epimerase [Ruminococcaceae bacterium]|nr:sugar phosphate isomerase/epimerase [Oscillospiraceae bacterium]